MAQSLLDEAEILTADMERFAVDMIRVNRGKTLRNHVEVLLNIWPLRDGGENRRQDDANSEASVLRPLEHVQSPLRRGHPRLDAPCKLAAHRSDGNL